MKISRDDLKWFLQNIRRRADVDSKELTDEDLVNELANYMETNPSCIDINGVSHSGRFSYSTVGYGVFSLLGEKYRMGRIEIFDREDESGYATAEGIYTMPFVAASQFEDFIESLETDLPINIEIGNHQWCVSECEKEMGIEKGKLNDPEVKKEYYKKKNDEYAQEKGYKDWDDYLESTDLGKKLKKSE